MTTRTDTWPAKLASGFRVSWSTVLLIAAINTGFAALLWVEDPRPFWHPLVSAQCFGFAIAYCVKVASPWENRRPIARLIAAVAVGTVVGMLFVFVIKGYSLADLQERVKLFGLTMFTGFTNGLFVSLFFLLKFRQARADAALHKAEAERHRLARHALESELKLMQAQIEPHFLFNTLASVQYLTETDPPRASRMLDHLIAYLRAALPQLRSNSTTLGQEAGLAEAYLNILAMRMGERLSFGIDVPSELAAHPFPPTMLVSIVENAVKHGLEAEAAGGRITIAAARNGDRLAVTVTDNGRGVAEPSPSPGQGVGLANVRERLAALYGDRARFDLDSGSPSGARATIEIPFEPAVQT
jgi:LytS/YehU family sensor histidine kinase